MKTNIIVNTSFSAIHCWPECPFPEVEYLKNPHRHVFYITAKKEVKRHDRELEFIRLKNALNEWIQEEWENKDIGSMSCEEICKKFFYWLDFDYIRVMEDNENGAEIWRE